MPADRQTDGAIQYTLRRDANELKENIVIFRLGPSFAMPYSLEHGYQRFGGTSRLHLEE
jgi:hypothetical protein